MNVGRFISSVGPTHVRMDECFIILNYCYIFLGLHLQAFHYSLKSDIIAFGVLIGLQAIQSIFETKQQLKL